jgi:hypothetical protein
MRQQDRQLNDDTPDVIKSEPVPVPGPGSAGSPPPDDPDGRHRSGYPDGDIADHGPEDALDERGSYDNDLATSGPGPWSDGDPGDPGGRDRPEFHEPAPLPTSFGAPTVGGAVAASALAGSHRDAREEDTVRSGDGPAEDRIDGVGDEPKRDHHATRGGDEDRSLGAADAAVGQRSDGPAVDRDAIDGTGTANPLGIGSAHPVNPDILSAGNPDTVAGEDHGPTTGSMAGTGGTTETGSTPDAGTTPDGELLPGAAPAEPIVAILSPDTVQGLRDRWREVQLRFVDDPPGATADAHRLVEESVDAVTTALAQQREELGGWQRDGATDTEQLRMVVRRHRDFLDRLLGT